MQSTAFQEQRPEIEKATQEKQYHDRMSKECQKVIDGEMNINQIEFVSEIIETERKTTRRLKYIIILFLIIIIILVFVSMQLQSNLNEQPEQLCPNVAVVDTEEDWTRTVMLYVISWKEMFNV